MNGLPILSILLLIAPVVLSSCSSLKPLLNESRLVWGDEIYGLQIAVYPVCPKWTTNEDPEFQVAFRNASKNDFFLNLGITLANGRNHFPNAISLELENSEGHSYELQFAEPHFIGGRVDDYAVALKADSIHIFKVKLSQFWSPSTAEFPIKLAKGHFKMTAYFHGHGALHKNTGMVWTAWNFWEGKLKSRLVKFDIEEP